MTFDTSFSDTPTVTATAESSNEIIVHIKSVSMSQVEFYTSDDGGNRSDSAFHFIAIGPR